MRPALQSEPTSAAQDYVATYGIAAVKANRDRALDLARTTRFVPGRFFGEAIEAARFWQRLLIASEAR